MRTLLETMADRFPIESHVTIDGSSDPVINRQTGRVIGYDPPTYIVKLDRRIVLPQSKIEVCGVNVFYDRVRKWKPDDTYPAEALVRG